MTNLLRIHIQIVHNIQLFHIVKRLQDVHIRGSPGMLEHGSFTHGRLSLLNQMCTVSEEHNLWGGVWEEYGCRIRSKKIIDGKQHTPLINLLTSVRVTQFV